MTPVDPQSHSAFGPTTQRRMHGINLAGWFVRDASANHLRSFAGEVDVARLANWRFTHLRLPIDIEVLSRAEGWAALDQALILARQYGLDCVIALRAADEVAWGLFMMPDAWQALAQTWETVAQRYRDWPAGGVLYELLDGPQPPDDVPPDVLVALGAPRPSPAAARRRPPPGSVGAMAWHGLASSLTERIRRVDQRHTIIVQAPGASPTAFTQFRPTRDPLTIYGFQCFEPAAFTLQGTPRQAAPRSVTAGYGAPAQEGADQVEVRPSITGVYPGEIAGERWDRERLRRTFEPALEFRRLYEVPLYLSAFGASIAAPRQARLTWIRSVLSLCHAQDLGWAFWTYRDPFMGLICDSGPYTSAGTYQNAQRLDYDLLGMIQSET